MIYLEKVEPKFGEKKPVKEPDSDFVKVMKKITIFNYKAFQVIGKAGLFLKEISRNL